MERLAIDGFAGFRETALEVGPVTVLIGPQATGKSIVAKLLYFFRETASRLSAAAADDRSKEEYVTECRQRFLRYFPPSSWGGGFRIVYTTLDKSITVSRSADAASGGKDGFELNLSEFYFQTLTDFARRKRDLSSATPEGEHEIPEKALENWRQELHKALDEGVGPWGKFEQIFVPAGRAFFSQVRASIFSNLESGGALDPFLVAFGALLERSKQILQNVGFFKQTEDQNQQRARIQSLRSSFSRILRADLLLIEKEYFLRFPDAREVQLAQASSGQQEALPLLLLLARFVSLGHARGRAVYIEEPEAHLFPITQRQVMELMAETYRVRSKQMRLVVTTHSPYILTSLNNLLQAGQRFANADSVTAARIEKIIPRRRSLRPGEVSAYALSDGAARSILDPETKLIDAALIDSVSTELAVEFDRLLSEE
jgi:hypothetical protein